MKIVQISTRDIRGGAAIAAYRLHQSLQQLGQDSTMAVRWKASIDPTVLQVTAQGLEVEAQAPEWQVIQRRYLDRNLTSRARTLFSASYPGFDLTALGAIAQADVLHLHWVSQLVSPPTLHQLLALGKPVVWTLHDMAPFTGGCHYASGCVGYQDSCSPCPQLRQDPYGLPAAALQDRLALLANYDNLTLVTPSQWLAEVARQSRLFGDRPIHVIPNPIETDVFQPLPLPAAKRRLGLIPSAFTFVAQSSNESRKEFSQLLGAIRRALQNESFRAAADNGKIQFLFFGNLSQPLEAPDIPHRHIGWRGTARKLAELYAAGDAFILPSLEDNLPNVMLESISCGTPLIAFDVGGMPDVIQPEKTGWLVPVGDFEQLAQRLVEVALQPETASALRPCCREEAEAHYAMPVIGQRFVDLYGSLLAHSGGVSPSHDDDAGGAIARFDATLGPHYEAIHKPVLFHALVREAEERQLLERHLQLVQAQLAEREQWIAAMESSKFWRLRSLWFWIKKRLGLPADE